MRVLTIIGNMIVFAAQLHRFNILTSGDRIITLSSYQQYAEEISKITNSGMGKEFVVIMIPSESTQEIDEFRNETPDETKERFRKRMNALIGELAKIDGRSAERVREDLKSKWVKEGLIKKSTTEFDIAGYAARINELLGRISEKKS